MSDLKFLDIAITVDANVNPNSFAVTDDKTFFVPNVLHYDKANPEALQVRQVADRLLGRTGPVLTLEIMQRAIDNCEQSTGHRPTRLIMSPAMRREYLKLL